MKELQVHYHGLGAPFWVGTLAEDSKEVLFQYSAQALARGMELSPIRLPLRPMAYPDRQTDYAKLHDVPGLLYDSLPDGWGFRLMHRRMRSCGINTEQVTTLDRLAYLSADTMGALTYSPAMTDAQDTRDLTVLELAQEVHAVLTDEGHLAPPYDLTYCPGYQGEHFMDVAGQGRDPTRQDVLKAAQVTGLARSVVESAIDEILAVVTPTALLERAEGLALHKSTVNTVHQALHTNLVRLSR